MGAKPKAKRTRKKRKKNVEKGALISNQHLTIQ